MRKLFALLYALALPAAAQELRPVPYWTEAVASRELPPMAERLPETPMISDLKAEGREMGEYGGTLRTFVSRKKDIRQMVVWGYARLVGYDPTYQLQPDILEALDIEGGRYTLRLRKGHRWSDGHRFTSEDFRYWYEDIATNPDLNPSGLPSFLKVEGQDPKVSFPDAETVVFEWPKPNPNFLPTLAAARPPFIYRPAHYLKAFHARYTKVEDLAQLMGQRKVSSWAALHNKYDNMYKNDNHALPTLQPWRLATKKGKTRFLFERNPYFHRMDAEGHQLPYIDQVEMAVVGAGLIATKTNAGEADLQARGLSFKDISVLKRGEKQGGNYTTRLWPTGVASQIALFPNLNYNDEAFRTLFRDVRFRRALSMGVDRRMINRALYFGLAAEGNMTVLPSSPFFRENNLKKWAGYDTANANALLDDMGLTARDAYGIRLLPDDRPLRIVLETAGERPEVADALAIIADTWKEIGVELLIRNMDRDILRNRVYAGLTMASAWFGWDNGLPQPETPPDFAAPVQQEFLSWPKWGQYHQTYGNAGEPPNIPEARRLVELAESWNTAQSREAKAAIWQEIVDIHADQLFAIGLLAGAPQPVAASKRLRNVPETAIWAWDPGAHFGITRMDQYFFEGGSNE